MDTQKIGHYLAHKRQAQNLTQQELADTLRVTNRAISKWENGRGLPDPSLMLELCRTLGISVNELLTGEDLTPAVYNAAAEHNLLQLQGHILKRNQELLNFEWVLGAMGSISFLVSMFLIATGLIPLVPAIILAILVTAEFIVGVVSAMWIERKIGSYECSHCQRLFIPRKRQFWFSMHLGRTRYMKCPYCHTWAWDKKVLEDTSEDLS